MMPRKVPDFLDDIHSHGEYKDVDKGEFAERLDHVKEPSKEATQEDSERPNKRIKFSGPIRKKTSESKNIIIEPVRRASDMEASSSPLPLYALRYAVMYGLDLSIL